MTGSALDGYDDGESTVPDDLKVAKRTLRKWRAEGIRVHPDVEVAERFYYSRAGRVAWLKSLEIKPPRSSRAA